MKKAIHPFFRTIIAQEAPGGKPSSVSVVVPTIVKTGQYFTVKIAVLDKTGYPSQNYRDSILLKNSAAQPKIIEVHCPVNGPATARVGGISINKEGIFRFKAQSSTGTFSATPL